MIDTVDAQSRSRHGNRHYFAMTGMLSDYLTGHHDYADVHIDLSRLPVFAGTRPRTCFRARLAMTVAMILAGLFPSMCGGATGPK